jgi:hypothetical protein
MRYARFVLPRPMPTSWMLDEQVTLLHADGSRNPSAFRVGVPEQVGSEMPGENYESSCWVHLDGVLDLGGPVLAGSMLGALTRALEILADHVRRAGRKGVLITALTEEEGALRPRERSVAPSSCAPPSPIAQFLPS